MIEGPKCAVESISVIKNDIEYIPLIHICQAYGISYDWHAQANKIKLYAKGELVTFALHEDLFDLNGSIKNLEKPVQIYEGALMVPKSVLELPWWRDVTVDKKVVPPALPKPTYAFDTIIIDPGHGGKDPGAVTKGIVEKHLVLDLSMQLKEVLEKEGFNVELTRSRDHFVSLADRARMANASGACDLFMSIHVNSHRDKRAAGFEIFYPSSRMSDGVRARTILTQQYVTQKNVCQQPVSNDDIARMAKALRFGRDEASICATFIDEEIRAVCDRSRGVKGGRYSVLNWVSKPAVLIELGFLSNTKEAGRLNTKTYQHMLVKAISRALLTYRDDFEKRN